MDLFIIIAAYTGLFSLAALVFAWLLHSVRVAEDVTALEALIRWLDLEPEDDR